MIKKELIKVQVERIGYSPDEARQLLGISRSLIWKLINEGEIKTIRLGRRRIIPKNEIERIMNESR